MGFVFTKNRALGEMPTIPASLTNSADFKEGLKIIQAFHDRASQYRSVYKFPDVGELIKFYGVQGPFMVDGLGMNARTNGIDLDEAKEVMEDLADEGKGKVPDNWFSYSTAMMNYAMNPGILKSLNFTAAESWKELKEPLTDLKEGTFTALKLSKYALPVLLWGGLGFLAYTWIKKSGKILDKVTDKLTQ